MSLEDCPGGTHLHPSSLSQPGASTGGKGAVEGEIHVLNNVEI